MQQRNPALSLHFRDCLEQYDRSVVRAAKRSLCHAAFGAYLPALAAAFIIPMRESRSEILSEKKRRAGDENRRAESRRFVQLRTPRPLRSGHGARRHGSEIAA